MMVLWHDGPVRNLLWVRQQVDWLEACGVVRAHWTQQDKQPGVWTCQPGLAFYLASEAGATPRVGSIPIMVGRM